ncbi:MAG: topoisomerase DNA-binding C4 zinc finger domain-containing protein [Promethearchaeota archaeon]|jgi:ssDNA-binding Zn-finger/Zn-ribbon topoisomerase 1
MVKDPKYCPRCGKHLEIRKGIYGTYLDCTGYPKCKYTVDISNKNVSKIKQLNSSTPSSCSKCGKKLALYIGKYGIFLGCNGYPNCNYSYNFDDPYNISCPKCGRTMEERNGAHGMFYGCKGYPKCKFTFDLRVKAKTFENKQPKKLVLPEGYGFSVKSDDILGALTQEGQNLQELTNKLKLTEEVDIRYLKLKLKEFANKNLIIMTSNENEIVWMKQK